MSNRIRISMQSLLTVAMSVAICRAEVRIKDITTIEGDRPNQLTGVGLVVGLNGTGAKSASTQQAVIDMLRKFDVTTKIARQSQEDNVYQSKNIAMVIVTADLPAFARKGSRIDVAVSIVDDATSLEGGTLLMTPLRGADGATYAVASGANSIGGFRVRQSGTGGQQNHPTVSRIPRGATVEREELGHIDLGGFVRLLLNEPDYSTSNSIAQVINTRNPGFATALDAGAVQVRIPLECRKSVPDFVSILGQMVVKPDSVARIVINERTGTVIVGHQVKISAVAIAHGNLVIKPNVTLTPAVSAKEGSVADPGRAGTNSSDGKPSDEIDDILEQLKQRKLPQAPPPQATPVIVHNVDQTFTVAELARILNALGVSPRDLIAIFQALKESGAMHADLTLM